MELKEAKSIALKLISELESVCERVEIAGSIRRKNSFVNDIEIVCIPKRESTGLFGGELVPVAGFASVINKYKKIRGDFDGKYTRRDLGEIEADIFMCTADNYGYIMAIRTGPSSFSHKVLAYGWKKKGLVGVEGMLYNKYTGIPLIIKEERELFKIIGLNYIPPEFRISLG
jgi:DNA polymerase/3'-5' exonuclease PolX